VLDIVAEAMKVVEEYVSTLPCYICGKVRCVDCSICRNSVCAGHFYSAIGSRKAKYRCFLCDDMIRKIAKGIYGKE